MKRVDAEILTVDDLAELFACDKETAAARLTSGDLPGVKVGRGWIIPRQALFERLNEKATEEAAARRAQWASAQEATPQCVISYKAASKILKKDTSTLLLTNIPPSQRGRKRRVPPGTAIT